MSKIKKCSQRAVCGAPAALSFYLYLFIYLSLIAPAYSAVCFLPDSGDCGAGGFNVKDDPCEDKTTYTVAQFESKFKFTKDCYLHFEFEKDGETHICVDDKNVLDGFNMDYRGHCCKIGTSWCEEQQACAEHCCQSGQEWCPAQEKCVEHCCPSGEEWCDRLGKCATKEECTPTCDEPKIYIPTLNECLCPMDRETDKNGNCCEVGEILNSNRECVKKAVCVGYTENKSKDKNCWSCTACLDDPNKFKCEENIKDDYEIEAGKCVKKPEPEPDPEPVSGCKGTEVMVGDKCVQLTNNTPTKEFSIENLAPYASFSNVQLCPENTVTQICPESANTGTSGCHYDLQPEGGIDCRSTLGNINKMWNTPLEITDITNRNSRLKDISEIQDAMKGKMCKDTNCTDTVTLSQIINGSSYVNKRDATTAADYIQKATRLMKQFKDEQKKNPSKCYDANFTSGYYYSIGNTICDVNQSNNTFYEFIHNKSYMNSGTPQHNTSVEELIDYYSKNPWKSDRTNKIFTFAFSKDVGTNYNYYGKIKLTSADEYAMAGYSKANYFQDHHGSYTTFNNSPIKVKLNSFLAQNRGNIVNLSIEAKSFTFGGGFISSSNIKADTVTFNGDTTLENVVIEANTIKFNNNSSLYVTGDNNFISQKVNLVSKDENGRFKRTEFSGSAGAIYVKGGNIYIYGNASEPVFSEFAVHEGKAQIMNTNSIAKKYSVKDWGKISIRPNSAYQYALQNFYYTDGEGAPQSGVDVAQYVVNDIILGNEYLCATKTCNSFGAYSKEEGWNPEYADADRIQTVCDGFTDTKGKSFECIKGSIPKYCVASNNECRYEIEDTYLSDLKSNGLCGYGSCKILALCAEVSSEQNVNLKCNEVLESSEYREDGYIFNSTRVKPFGWKGSKKCAICLYDSTEGQ